MRASFLAESLANFHAELVNIATRTIEMQTARKLEYCSTFARALARNRRQELKFIAATLRPALPAGGTLHVAPLALGANKPAPKPPKSPHGIQLAVTRVLEHRGGKQGQQLPWLGIDMERDFLQQE